MGGWSEEKKEHQEGWDERAMLCHVSSFDAVPRMQPAGASYKPLRGVKPYVLRRYSPSTPTKFSQRSQPCNPTQVGQESYIVPVGVGFRKQCCWMSPYFSLLRHVRRSSPRTTPRHMESSMATASARTPVRCPANLVTGRRTVYGVRLRLGAVCYKGHAGHECKQKVTCHV